MAVAVRPTAFRKTDDEVSGFPNPVFGSCAGVLLSVGAEETLRDESEFGEHGAVPSR